MEFIVFLLLLLAAGWVLGLVGFFKALRALREVAALRLRLATAAAAPAEAPPAPIISPWAAPPVAPEAEVPEAVPEAPAGVEPAEPEPEAPDLAPPRPPRDLEALLTQRWGVWLGAAALLLSGVFLVRYAVDQGLLGPAVRCTLAALLGVALVAGAEWFSRRPAPDDAGLGRDQMPPALAAGGVAVLFGAAYGAGPLYDLVPPIIGFILLAAAALAGLALSLRYGVLVAAIGIVGAYATPALVAADAPYAPGLFGYLLLVTAAALAVVRHTAWAWLGWAATIAGALWVALAATGGLGPETWAPGLFVPAAACLHLLLLPAVALDHPIGRRLSWLPFAALAAAGLLLAAAVPDPWVRAGLLLLSPLAVWRGATEERLDRLPWLSALVFLLALLVWALPAWQPTGEVLATEGYVMAVLPGAWAPDAIQPLLGVAALMAAFYALAGLWLERRRQRRLPWSALVAAVPVLTLAVTYVQVGLFQPVTMWAFAALALTGGLTAAAWAAGADRQRAGVHAAGAVAALALGCAMLLSDQWLTLAIALLYLARRTGRVVQGWAWRLLGVVALFSAVLLLLGNPLVTNDPAGQTALLCGYLLPALLAGLASQAPELGKQNWAKLLGGYAVLAGFLWVGLEIRLLYHPGALGLDAAPIDEGELWAWSGGWLVYGGALMALGMATGQRAIRLAALAIIGLVTAKAFLIDMAGLEGLWRVLSFLGLGLMLIGIGGAYRRFVGQKEK